MVRAGTQSRLVQPLAPHRASMLPLLNHLQRGRGQLGGRLSPGASLVGLGHLCICFLGQLTTDHTLWG